MHDEKNVDQKYNIATFEPPVLIKEKRKKPLNLLNCTRIAFLLKL